MTLFQERPIRPMLAKTGEPFDSDEYLFEVKWDGLRALLFLENGRVELQNRNLRDATPLYPEIQNVAKEIKAKKAILDGEVIVLNEKGVPDFGRMQTRFGHNDPSAVESSRIPNPATYAAFDLIHLDGRDMLKDRLEERKAKLRDVMLEGPHMMYGEHLVKEGRRFYSELLKAGFEGVVAKERGSQYLPGVRSSAWVKIKGTDTIDAVVAGIIAGEGARTSTFGSLVMAMYDKQGKLAHVGNVGGGFDEETLVELKSILDKLTARTPTITEPVEAPAPIVWVKPRIVCQILYASVTRDHKLRFPRFQRLRPDKNPEDCVLDERILSR